PEGYRYLGGERRPVPHPNVQGRMLVKRGAEEIEDVFASAARVFEHTYRTPRHHPGYIEPHATLVWIEDEIVHVVTTNKGPYGLRGQLAATTGLPASQIVVHV